jgi:glucose-1-phosphate cytidylyltransferase
MATLTGIHPASSYGVIEVENGIAKNFKEKPQLDGMINGGFMVLNKNVFKYISDIDCMFEDEPLMKIAADGELAVFEHNGFWTAIDTFKDVEKVNALYNSKKIPWKV